MQRYHPLLAALHWLMALMIVFALAAGGIALANMEPDSPDKVKGLGGHIFFGMAIGVPLILRLATRTRSAHPPKKAIGSNLVDRLGLWTHWGLYLLFAGMVLTGLVTAFGAGPFPIAYAGATETLPPELTDLPQRAAHGFIVAFLMWLIVLHIAAAQYHQYLFKDGFLGRMWVASLRHGC